MPEDDKGKHRSPKQDQPIANPIRKMPGPNTVFDHNFGNPDNGMPRTACAIAGSLFDLPLPVPSRHQGTSPPRLQKIRPEVTAGQMPLVATVSLTRPRTSRPASESGSVADWIGNGEVTPESWSDVMIGAGTPSSAKVASSAGFGATLAASNTDCCGACGRGF